MTSAKGAVDQSNSPQTITATTEGVSGTTTTPADLSYTSAAGSRTAAGATGASPSSTEEARARAASSATKVQAATDTNTMGTLTNIVASWVKEATKMRSKNERKLKKMVSKANKKLSEDEISTASREQRATVARLCELNQRYSRADLAFLVDQKRIVAVEPVLDRILLIGTPGLAKAAADNFAGLPRTTNYHP